MDSRHDVQPFRADVETLVLQGELDIADQPALKASFARLARHARIVVDLSAVTYMDSSAFQCSSSLRQRKRAQIVYGDRIRSNSKLYLARIVYVMNNEGDTGEICLRMLREAVANRTRI